jgi:hypothetical protein
VTAFLVRAGISRNFAAENSKSLVFFLQTYAHVLRNDDRDAAEQAAAFLIGGAMRWTWARPSDKHLEAKFAARSTWWPTRWAPT